MKQGVPNNAAAVAAETIARTAHDPAVAVGQVDVGAHAHLPANVRIHARAERIPLVAGVEDDALLVEIIARNEVMRLLAAPAKLQLVILNGRGPEDFLLPVGVGQRGGDFRRDGAAEEGRVGEIGVVVDHRFVENADVLGRVSHRNQPPVRLYARVGIERDARCARRPPPRGDHNDAVGRPRPVDGGG